MAKPTMDQLKRALSIKAWVRGIDPKKADELDKLTDEQLVAKLICPPPSPELYKFKAGFNDYVPRTAGKRPSLSVYDEDYGDNDYEID